MNKKTEVSKCCDVALELLIEIRDKINQIIEYKKTHPSGERDELFRRQVGAFMSALNNLYEINNSIGSAISDVRKLCERAHQLLHEQKPVVSLSATDSNVNNDTNKSNEDDK